MYSVRDITVCMSIRNSAITEWIPERLMEMLNYYEPKPKFLVVDFGSEGVYKDQVKKICEDAKATLIYVNDNGDFSPAIGRNLAYANSKTDLLCFVDVDLKFKRNVFGQMVGIANDLDINKNRRVMLNFPVYHLGEQQTKDIQGVVDKEESSRLFTKMAYALEETKYGDGLEFIAPYSNSFFLHRDLYSMAGGYCEDFRGHGSEDFEYLVRLMVMSTDFPIPKNIMSDKRGPLRDLFAKKGSYEGFRSLFELSSRRTESLGIKCFHLFHSKPAEDGYWTKTKDAKRIKFNKIVNKYRNDWRGVLDVDYIKREKKVACIIESESDWSAFVPLRLFGYKTVWFDSLGNFLNGKNNINGYDLIVVDKFPNISIEQKSKLMLKNVMVMSISERSIEFIELSKSSDIIAGDGEYTEVDIKIDSGKKRMIVSSIKVLGQEVDLGLAVVGRFSWRSYIGWKIGIVEEKHYIIKAVKNKIKKIYSLAKRRFAR